MCLGIPLISLFFCKATHEMHPPLYMWVHIGALLHFEHPPMWRQSVNNKFITTMFGMKSFGTSKLSQCTKKFPREKTTQQS